MKDSERVKRYSNPQNREDWLESRGGRNVGDMGKDDNGYYVFMSRGSSGYKKIYLPNNLQY